MVPTCKNVAPYSPTPLNVGTMVNVPLCNSLYLLLYFYAAQETVEKSGIAQDVAQETVDKSRIEQDVAQETEEKSRKAQEMKEMFSLTGCQVTINMQF